MSRTLKDARQIGLRKLLSQIGNRTHHEGTDDAKPANQSELDNLLDSIDLDLTKPLRMDASNPADLTISVGPAIVENTESGRKKTIPHVGNLLPNDFTAGTVVFPSTSGGTITITPGNNVILTVTNNNYIKVLIYMDAEGNLNALAGVENVVEADATVLPPPRNTLPLGYVTLFNNAGTIDNIAQGSIYDFGIGTGGSGAGDASSIEETIKNRLLDSYYDAVTAIIFERDEDNLLDGEGAGGASTGEFSLVTNNFEMNTGETMVSTQMVDSEFLSGGQSLNAIELMAFWDLDNIDTGATYEVSRDGGSYYQTLTMERVDDTEIYRGDLLFDGGETDVSLALIADGANEAELNDTTQQRIGQIRTIANTGEIRNIELNFAINGAPTGKMYVAIAKDDGGSPGNILAETNAVDISTLSAGANDIAIPAAIITPGDYHVVIRTDDEYKLGFVASTTSIALTGNAGSGTPGDIYDGAAWSAATFDIGLDVQGFEYDLRIRVTASADSNLNGTGIFYDKSADGLQTGILNRETRVFDSVADNFNEFTLTSFTPNIDTLKVYYIEAGQVFTNPAFAIEGQKVVFATDQFNNGGVPATVTLVFDQSQGGAFDNSDLNALLMAENFLGSTDPSVDRSANGRGIRLRSPDGTLYEITIADGGGSLDVFEVT